MIWWWYDIKVILIYASVVQCTTELLAYSLRLDVVVVGVVVVVVVVVVEVEVEVVVVDVVVDGVVVVAVVVGSVAATLHEFSTRYCKTMLSCVKFDAKKKYSGVDAISLSSSSSTSCVTPTVYIMMSASFVSLASSRVWSASRVAVPSVSSIRILGIPLRAPFNGVIMSSRALRRASAMFVCPPLMSTLPMALNRESRSPYLLRWKTISTPLLNFINPTWVRLSPIGNAPAILLAKPSTCLYQLS